MQKLPEPEIDDQNNIRKLSENNKATATFPYLKDRLEDILATYQRYIDERGNACMLQPLGISDPLKKGLLSSYGNPPKALKSIKSLRVKNEVCPMCGSEGTWSLDHLLPKENFPEWALFSKNLVPACHCNISRKSALVGDALLQQRILHPYFDDVLQERLLSCSITTTNGFRWVDLSLVYLQTQHPLHEAVKYHVTHVVKPAGIEKRLQRNLMTKLRAKPSSVIRGLYEKNILTEEEVREVIAKDLRWYDENKETPNNWNSIFLHGLLNSEGVVAWVTELHNVYVLEVLAR